MDQVYPKFCCFTIFTSGFTTWIVEKSPEWPPKKKQTQVALVARPSHALGRLEGLHQSPEREGQVSGLKTMGKAMGKYRKMAMAINVITGYFYGIKKHSIRKCFSLYKHKLYIKGHNCGIVHGILIGFDGSLGFNGILRWSGWDMNVNGLD